MPTLMRTSFCQECGARRQTGGGGGGFCPRCLLALALDVGSEDEEITTEAATLDLPEGGLAPGRVLGRRYRVHSLLGHGGVGEVWRSYDLKLRMEVALKALHAPLRASGRALESLRQEVRAARAIVSPNVCRVYDLVEVEGRDLVSMEYVDGTTLYELLVSRGALPLEEAGEIAAQLLAGLEAIHDAGLVHLDLKPENVMLTRTGRIVVMDLGVAKDLSDQRTGTVAGTPAYMAPEHARGETVDARADVFAAGVVLAEMVAPGGVSTSEARQAVWEGAHREPPQVADTPWAGVLRRALAGSPDRRYANAAALARALEEVALRVAGADDLHPFPGLRPFTAENAEYFFGREYEVEATWKKLGSGHLLGLIGPSGAGKSSFLRAGLLPALPGGWAAVICTPGSRPARALAQALARELVGDPDAIEQLPGFDQPETAVALVSRWRRRHENALVVVDQFEELFTRNPPEVHDAFARLLGRLVLDADVRVLLSMRDDFLFRCHAHESLLPLFSELIPLGPPTGAALRRAVVQPALRCGYRFEDEELVDDMLTAVEGERGALPLLAFAAARLWEQRDREAGLLTREAYEQIGGVAGALAQHAEATLERIGSARIPVVREIFRNLVTAQGTRMARDRDDLLSVFDREERQDAALVLDALVDGRLLTAYELPAEEGDQVGRSQVEIVHESLLASWPRLVRWRAQDTEGAQLRDELRQAAHLWEQHQRSDDLLWTGTAFRELRIWRERYPGRLTEQEEAFASAMAAKATRRRRRRRVAVAIALALTVGIAAVTSFLWRRSETAATEAREEARRAEASKLVALAHVRRAEDPTEALAYTTASLELFDTEEARVFAARLLAEGPPASEVDSGGDLGLLRPLFNPEGSRLAAVGFSDKAWVWGSEGGPPLVLEGHETELASELFAGWFSDDVLVTGVYGGREVRIWKLPEGKRLRTIEFDGPAFWQVAEAQPLLAEIEETDPETGRRRRRLRSWRLPDGDPRELGSVDRTAIGTDSGWFDPDGSGWLYTRGKDLFYRPLPARESVPDRLVGSHEHEARFAANPTEADRVWTLDASTGEARRWDLSRAESAPTLVIPALDGVPGGRRPDPSGRWAVDDLDSGFARVWDLLAWPGVRPLLLRRSGSWFFSSATFHPRGDRLVISTHGYSRLTFWPLRGAWPWVVDGYTGGFRPLAFSPDGRWLATFWPDASLRLWPLPGNDAVGVKTIPVPSDWVLCHDLAFDPRGRFLVVVYYTDLAYVVPLDGSPPTKLGSVSMGKERTGLSAAAVSPSGRLVATAYRAGTAGRGDRTLRVWDVESGELRRYRLPTVSSPIPGGEWGVWDLAFADESTLYTSGAGGIVRWNLTTGAHEVVLPTKAGSLVMSAAFLPGARKAVVLEPMPGDEDAGTARIVDLATGDVEELSAFEGASLRSSNLWPRSGFDVSRKVALLGDKEGIVRVASLSGGEPHLLLGHQGFVDAVAVSPDGRWIASSGEDNTLRLWPMPELENTPLQALPRDELIARLRSMTNIRVVRDPEAPDHWTVVLDPFPGWETVPTH